MFDRDWDRVTYNRRGGRARARSFRRSPGCHVVIDTDGVLTDGKLYVDADGTKPFKAFGPDDHAAVKRWRSHMDIHVITSDDQPMCRLRAEHMGVSFAVVGAEPSVRLQWMADYVTSQLHEIVYVGDGYHDADIMQIVGFGIAVADAWPATFRAAHARTSCMGGARAVAQALDFIGKELIG